LKPHNVPFTFIGASLLWVGWFGFNAGSAVAADEIASLAMINTMVATAAGVVAWSLVEALAKGRPSALGAASGAIAGLVGITPAAGTVGPMGAIVIGLAAGAICVWGVNGLKRMLRVDDTADVFGVHAIGGIVGAVLTGVFSAESLGGTGIEGTIGAQVWAQTFSVLFTIVWCAVVTSIAILVAKAVFGLRVTEEEERQGLDIVSHGESAYESGPQRRSTSPTRCRRAAQAARLFFSGRRSGPRATRACRAAAGPAARRACPRRVLFQRVEARTHRAAAHVVHGRRGVRAGAGLPSAPGHGVGPQIEPEDLRRDGVCRDGRVGQDVDADVRLHPPRGVRHLLHALDEMELPFAVFGVGVDQARCHHERAHEGDGVGVDVVVRSRRLQVVPALRLRVVGVPDAQGRFRDPGGVGPWRRRGRVVRLRPGRTLHEAGAGEQ